VTFFPQLNIVIHRTRFPNWLIHVSFSVKIVLTPFMMVILFKLKKLG